MINVDFSVDMRRIDLWAYRMGVDLFDVTQLSEPYILAQQYILQMVKSLVKFHGFRHVEPTDHRMLFAVVCDAPRIQTPPGFCIELPIHVSSFFTPDRRLQWESVFHSKLWFDHEHCAPGTNTVTDLLYLLQCLLPGMFLVVEVRDGWTTQRGIPRLHWLYENKHVLVSTLGHVRYTSLCQAAADVKTAVIDSRDTEASR